MALACFSLVALGAKVPGFAESFEKPAAPNTVRGVLKAAKAGDYCLVRGIFLEKLDDYAFMFSDEDGGTVEVRFKPEAGLSKIFLKREYFVWATVEQDFRHTYLLAQLFTPSSF